MEQKVYRLFLNQSKLLVTEHNNAEITVGNVGCDVFCCNKAQKQDIFKLVPGR